MFSTPPKIFQSGQGFLFYPALTANWHGWLRRQHHKTVNPSEEWTKWFSTTPSCLVQVSLVKCDKERPVTSKGDCELSAKKDFAESRQSGTMAGCNRQKAYSSLIPTIKLRHGFLGACFPAVCLSLKAKEVKNGKLLTRHYVSGVGGLFFNCLSFPLRGGYLAIRIGGGNNFYIQVAG